MRPYCSVGKKLRKIWFGQPTPPQRQHSHQARLNTKLKTIIIYTDTSLESIRLYFERNTSEAPHPLVFQSEREHSLMDIKHGSSCACYRQKSCNGEFWKPNFYETGAFENELPLRFIFLSLTKHTENSVPHLADT